MKWKAVLDDQTCDKCLSLNGSEITKNETPPNFYCESESGECRCVAEGRHMKTTKKKPIGEIREIFVEGDLTDKIRVARYGNYVEINGTLKTTSLRILIRVQAAIAILLDELLELGTRTPGAPALVDCKVCRDEFFVEKFDPTLTAFYCRDQKKRECHEREPSGSSRHTPYPSGSYRRQL